MDYSSIKRIIKLYLLPVSIAGGILAYALFHMLPALQPIKYPLKHLVESLLPWLLFIMLFTAFCKVDAGKMKPKLWHWYLVAFQAGGSFAIAWMVHAYPDLPMPLAWAGLAACIICPTAAAAVVITGKLGGSESSLTTYTIMSNLAAAAIIPAAFPLMATHSTLPFWSSFFMILAKSFPVIVLPLVSALVIRAFLPKLHQLVLNKSGDLAFYVWGFTLVAVSAQAVSAVMNAHEGLWYVLLLVFTGLAATVIQFALGTLAGLPEGQKVSAGQGLGQKNMVFGVWIVYLYLDSDVAIVLGSYLIWQNCANALQLWQKDRADRLRAGMGLPPYSEA